MLQIDLSPIKEIEAKVQNEQSRGILPPISLSQGALRLGGVPVEIKEHLKKVLDTDKTDYYQSAWGILPLREKIATHLSKKHNTEILYKNVLVTHGCMGALSTLLLTLLDDGDEVIIPEPTYPAYKNIVLVSRGVPVFVSSVKGGTFVEGDNVRDRSFFDNKDCWKLDFEKIKAARTEKTKILLFSNPCNPTGFITQKKQLEEMADWCEKHKIYLIVDESYDGYIFEKELFSATSLIGGGLGKKKYEYVIRTGSYSKSLSMSGWRVGYMVVPELLSCKMGITQDAVLNCPNVITQHAVLYALDNPEYTKKFNMIVKKNRDISCEMLKKLVDSGKISFQKPDAGFYLFFKIEKDFLKSVGGALGQKNNTFDLCFDILNKTKVGLIPGMAFGKTGDPFLRLCYARTEDVLCEGIERIVNFLEP